jgi:N-hydroxyarylamine O-acetyltransferase
MADPVIDLDAYCARIGYAGSRAPTLEALQTLQRLHTRAIAFENIDVVLKRPIRIDPESLQKKIVAGGRGGYCYESNGLFMHVLRAMGFATTALSARVLFERAETQPLPPRSHMLQRVDIDGEAYIVDVAFGALTPAAVLRYEPDLAQKTPRESYRLVPAGDEFDVQVQLGAAWHALYRFATQPHLPVDYEQPNWHVSTHPESYFVNNLIVAAPREDVRYTLFNDEFRTRTPDGRVESRKIASGRELVDLLEGRFALRLTGEDRAALALRPVTPVVGPEVRPVVNP